MALPPSQVKSNAFAPVTAANAHLDVAADGNLDIVDLSVTKNHVFELTESCP